MSKSSKYWDKRALRRLNEAEKSSEAYIKRVKAIYDRAYKDTERELASIYKNYSKETGLDTQKLKELLTKSETKELWDELKRQGLDKYVKNNYKARISRIEKIQAQIYAKAKEIYPKEELQNTMCYKGVINDSYYKTMYDTQMGTGYDFNFATIDNNMVNSLLTERWSGKNYSQRIWGNTDILANTLSEMVGGALMSGQSTQLTAKQIRDRFNVSKYYAERLIRTETNHFNNEADAMAYEELGLKKYVFVATLDSRTSEICQSMDGKVFDYKDREEGVNYPPLHPNCRSKTRAYLGEEAEKDLKRRARDPFTGKTEIIDNISYKEWIKQQSDRPIIEATHYTNKDNVKSIYKNGFNFNNSGKVAGNTFGKAIYFTNGTNEKLFYQNRITNSAEVTAYINTKDFLKVQYEGYMSTKNKNNLYTQIVNMLKPNEQKEYKERYKEILKQNSLEDSSKWSADPKKDSLIPILEKNYAGLIIKQNTTGIDIITGGNQIVVYDLKRIKIKK